VPFGIVANPRRVGDRCDNAVSGPAVRAGPEQVICVAMADLPTLTHAELRTLRLHILMRRSA